MGADWSKTVLLSSTVQLTMQLLMGVPQLVEVVDSGSVWHNAAILAGLVYKLLCIFGISAKLAPLPARMCKAVYSQK